MPLTRYGSDVLIAVIVISVVLFGLAAWIDESWLQWILVIIGLFLIFFSLNFFRDPDRTVDLHGRDLSQLVVCPADGKVVVLKDVVENEYIHGPTIMLSIFMNPMNVHVNRSPMTGVIEYFRYVKGEFLVAHDEQSSHRNERAIIGLNSNGRKIVFTQVAGYIARRIVCNVKVGDTLHAGVRYGMIKFGSRVDVFMPPNAKVLVKLGEEVKSGETVLAEFPNF